jgi:decaprenylphospho-beta-D-ribofuranose 2-oxidase
MRELSGWGRYPRAECRVVAPHGEAELRAVLAQSPSLIARGNGRSYGDSALNPDATLAMRHGDRLLDFDPATGRLAAQAGVMLADIISTFLPRGFFPPVTPGTKFVTLGGMIAADVHGKNHHKAGSFGDHVESFDLMRADGSVVRCAADENRALFDSTRGGMGLTGVILRATFRLMPVETAYIRQETLRARDLDETMELFERSQDWTYSVAWIDCLARNGGLGRSLLFRGEHATAAELPETQRKAPFAAPSRRAARVPFDLPALALNRWSVRAFNALHYRRAGTGAALVDYDRFFYPLDAVLEWNRLYGGKGLVQYQCVIPKDRSRAGLTALLERIAAAGVGSFLSVLKLLGPGHGMLSFPLEGYTLALDFPFSGPALDLLNALDEIVAAHGGRVYLAKDARLKAETLRRFYPGLDDFAAARKAADPDGRFASLQSRRLAL